MLLELICTIRYKVVNKRNTWKLMKLLGYMHSGSIQNTCK